MRKKNSKEIEKKILNWFKKKRKKISINQDFLNDNILDSFDLIEFVTFLEKEFIIKFNPEELSNQSFPIIKKLAKIIEKKINGL
tara:strand:+ start:70 stop:321 length:252 start_codon:yes stop_codon:yes gene_type:complete